MPPSPALLEGQQWGDRFHLLMQQQEMGLPIDPVLVEDGELQACLTQLKQQAPDLFDSTGEIFRQSEHARSLTFNQYWFTVIYDLLREWEDRAEIIDWKTYLKPRDLKFLQRDWQTRLYLYTLVETTTYRPEQVSMTYWFVRAQSPEGDRQTPQQVRVPYSDKQHTQTHEDLRQLTERLTQLLKTGESFPQVPVGSPKCEACPFAVRCHRSFANASEAIALPALGDIEEIAI